MLTLTFLGVGSAFAKRNFQSNALIEAWTAGPNDQEAPNDTLLIDFGTTGPIALHHLKGRPGFSYLDRGARINYAAIRRIFVTHLHSDHIGGLEELAGMNAYDQTDPDTDPGLKPAIIGSSDLLASLWEDSLKGGLGARHGHYARMEEYFVIAPLRPVEKGGPDRFTMLDQYVFTIFPTDHIRVEQKYDWPSYGLLITDERTGETVVYSSDTRFDVDSMGEMMARAKINFHDVLLEDQPQPVHALLSQMRTLPEHVRRKTVLYHFGDTWDSGAYDFVPEEFAGFARPQHRYTLFA